MLEAPVGEESLSQSRPYFMLEAQNDQCPVSRPYFMLETQNDQCPVSRPYFMLENPPKAQNVASNGGIVAVTSETAVTTQVASAVSIDDDYDDTVETTTAQNQYFVVEKGKESSLWYE